MGENLTVANPISDDTLDYVDSQVERLAETENLGEKISIHQQLKETIKRLENEINELAERIDKIDTETFKELSTIGIQENNDDPSNGSLPGGSLPGGIANIERLVGSLQNEEILQNKVAHFERLADIVKNCKLKCIASDVRLKKCN